MEPVASDSTDNTQIVIHNVGGGERFETTHEAEQQAPCGGQIAGCYYYKRLQGIAYGGVYLLVASLITAAVIHIDQALDTKLLENSEVVGALRGIVQQAFSLHSANSTR